MTVGVNAVRDECERLSLAAYALPIVFFQLSREAGQRPACAIKHVG